MAAGENGHDQATSRYAAAETPGYLTWKELRVTAQDVKGGEKVILNSVSGFCAPNHMLAIMGPSGCGKTTLLDTLAGRHPKNVTVKGDVLLNGRASQLSYGVSAYVTQDEVLVGVLSVRETLEYAALLRLPSEMSYRDKINRVDDVLLELGLSDAQHTKIGNWFLKGVSGGQKRRVSIGCELVTHPTIMFLDEPTSGLDAASAYFVMDTIRKLAAHGRTILTVIHQPSSEVFELFDQLALLTRGNMIYFGAADKALSMFESAGLPCPATRSATDHFLHVVNQDFITGGHGQHGDVEQNINTLMTLYSKSLLPDVLTQVEQYSNNGAAAYQCNACGASWMYQNWVLTKRNLINNWRNVGIFWLRLAMYLMLCICIGTIYLRLDKSWKDSYGKTSMMFFIVAFLTFMSISGFPAFVEDMAVFMRERLNGYYNVSTFAIANTLASAPFIFGIAISSSAVVYWLVNLNDDGDRFVYFFINLFVSLMVVESLMMAIAAVVPHYLMGIAGGAGIMGMYMLVCGFFQPVGALPAPFWRYPLHYIAYHSYAFSGFMRNEFSGTTGWSCPCADTLQGCPAPCSMTGEDILEYWLKGGNGLNKWVDVGIQVAMIAIYRMFFWGMLVLKEKMRS